MLKEVRRVSWTRMPGLKPPVIPLILLVGLEPHPPTEMRICAFFSTL